MNQLNPKEPEQLHKGFYRLPQILDRIPIGSSTFWKWVAEGKAPKGIKLGAKTTVWKKDDIHKLIKKLEASA